MIYTVHMNAVTSLVSCEFGKVQNYDVMSPKTSEMSQPVHTRIVTLYKNGEIYWEIVKKIGLAFSIVRYTIKHFFATKSLRNDHCSG